MFSDEFWNFFKFGHVCEDNRSLSFGYDRNIVSYDFLAKRAELADIQQTLPFNGPNSDFEYLVRIRFKDYGKVKSKLTETARTLYAGGKKVPVRISRVERHDACTTNPYKVTANVDGKKRIFYIKKPDLKRAIGKAFYNLLVDKKFIVYKFNDEGFAVDSVPGSEIEDNEREKLVQRRRFVEEVVRLNFFTNLIFLDDILQQTNANCSYSEKHGIYLFDFDRCFTDGNYHVISRFEEIRDKVNVRSVEEDERYRIFPHLRGNRRKIEDLLKILSKDLPEKELAWKHGEDSLGDVLRKGFDKLGNW